jgi:hypothetical protein
MNGWVGGRAGLSIAYSNQKIKKVELCFELMSKNFWFKIVG